MVKIDSKAERKVNDYKLSRYACHLIGQKAELAKEVNVLDQTYFAVQTRGLELSEHEYCLLSNLCHFTI